MMRRSALSLLLGLGLSFAGTMAGAAERLNIGVPFDAFPQRFAEALRAAGGPLSDVTLARCDEEEWFRCHYRLSPEATLTIARVNDTTDVASAWVEMRAAAPSPAWRQASRALLSTVFPARPTRSLGRAYVSIDGAFRRETPIVMVDGLEVSAFVARGVASVRVLARAALDAEARPLRAD